MHCNPASASYVDLFWVVSVKIHWVLGENGAFKVVGEGSGSGQGGCRRADSKDKCAITGVYLAIKAWWIRTRGRYGVRPTISWTVSFFFWSVSLICLQSNGDAGRILRAIFDICLKRGWAVPAKAALDLCKTEDAEKHDTIEIVQGRSERSCEESRRKTTCKLFLFHCCFVCADVFDSIALLRPLATQDWRCRAQPLRKDWWGQ